MQIAILGVNHKTAEIPLREAIASACQQVFSQEHCTFQHVLLSTCNRTEIYFYAKDLGETHSYFLQQLRCYIDQEFEHSLYTYFSADCFAHLCRVTAGLDSAIFAETEIQGQVKLAYKLASEARQLPKELHFLFQKALATGKQLRNHLCLHEPKDSLQQKVLAQLKTTFAAIASLPVLFIGASSTNQKISQHLRQAGMQQLFFCNRTPPKQPIANWLPWQERGRWVDFPVVIVATTATSYLLHPQPSSLHKQLIIDLSMPRNVDPRVAIDPKTTLLNLQDFTSRCQPSPQALNSVEAAIALRLQRMKIRRTLG